LSNSGDHTGDVDDSAYPYSTVSWFFLDAIDVLASSDTAVVCDGTFSTLNGNDRWANDLSRRLHEKYGNRVSVVNEGIGGNTVQGPGAGPSAEDRLDRDVLALSGLASSSALQCFNSSFQFINTKSPPLHRTPPQKSENSCYNGQDRQYQSSRPLIKLGHGNLLSIPALSRGSMIAG
jgi:hypothetical protein